MKIDIDFNWPRRTIREDSAFHHFGASTSTPDIARMFSRHVASSLHPGELYVLDMLDSLDPRRQIRGALDE